MLIPKFIRRYIKQKEMLRFYGASVTKNDLCFDIGANIGERTNCFLKLGAKVICVEPQSSCFDVLQKKFKSNNQVQLLKVALGNSEREDVLMICDESTECSTLSKDFISTYTAVSRFNWSQSEKIKVTTLESLCRQFGTPRFCKIDVEGFESEVLSGLKTPIQFICFEFNRPLINDTIKSFETLNSIANYECNFIKYETMQLVLDKWLPANEFKNRIEQLITKDILTGEIIARIPS